MPQPPVPIEGGLRLAGRTITAPEGLPLVSIVTVVLNGQKHLRQTIESVLGQTYPYIEYIILDGGSTDGTLDIVQAYDDRLAYWRSAPDAGIYPAMNEGISLCTGTLIGLKNADDWYTPHAVADVVKTWQATGADFVYGDTLVVWQEDPLQTSLFRSDHHRITRDGGVDHRTVFATQALYARHRYDTHYRICADYDWYLQIVNGGGSFAHTGTVISYKRPGGASASPQTLKDAFAINRKYFGLAYALRVRARQAWVQLYMGLVNTTLRTLLGAEGLARFKARKLKQPS